ncbi:MAG TPA: cadherin-like domain-containing protein [Aromatoleum sp.]|uniref:cadherin-like domain-containing protein n=1 Tax=Aromatoleum sp. TaxID=2307007 RepID=UPI002B463DC8|nr:cadherin-like domain-containing protein [Aromatoleum sp.]HJV28053.1 cadherin-like domain-containing protein [Aromatoleum sp.]
MATSSVSYTNTPQATDDVYGFQEDSLDPTGSIFLDVMSNDLGGKAKTLYSVEDSDSALKDLLSTDVGKSMVSAWETTADGNQIRINCGKIEFKFADDFNVNSVAADETYSDSFVYAIRLANGTLSYATVTVNIAGANDGPALTGTQATLIDGSEDTAYTVSAADLLAGFSDVDGDTLAVSGLTADYGTVSANADGSFTITPAADYNGTLKLTYEVVDGNGGSVAATQSFTLAAVNDAPTGTATAALASGTEDTAYTVSAAQLLEGFSDVDVASNGQVLSVSGLSASDGSVTDNGDGTYTVTPSANFNGTMTLSYSVIDGEGGSADATQSYTVAAVNDAPTGTATAALAGGTEDTAYTVSAAQLLEGFSDVDVASNGQVLSVSGLSASDGSVTDNGDGTYTVTPSANFNGTMTLSYSVIDGEGGSADATQSYTVAAVNDAPTGSATAVLDAGTEDTAYTVSAAQLLQGFSDADVASNGQVLSVSGLSASDGSVTDNGDGTYTVTPSANFNGTMTLNYRVIDGEGGSADATQSYTVAAVNDAPTGSATAVLDAGTEDTAYTVSAAQLLQGFSDVDGDTLAVSGLTADHGAVAANSDGSFTITPAADYNGLLKLSYIVVDGHGGSIAAAQSTTLAAVDDGVAATDLKLVVESAPTGNSLPGASSPIGHFAYTDPDGGSAAHTFTLSGVNASAFTLSSSGSLSAGASGLAASTTYTFGVTVAQAGQQDYSEDFTIITGSNGGETLVATAGDAAYYAGGNSDTILAGAGDDIVFGQNSNDSIHGGEGNDVLYGNLGNDFFVFDTALNASTNVDALKDFTHAIDKIQLDDTVFSGGQGFGANVLYDASTGTLSYDANGGSHTDAVQFATVAIGTTIDQNDFQFI